MMKAQGSMSGTDINTGILPLYLESISRDKRFDLSGIPGGVHSVPAQGMVHAGPVWKGSPNVKRS